MEIRRHSALNFKETSPMSGQFEVDESYFGSRYKGKRGRGAENKTMNCIAFCGHYKWLVE